MGHYLLGAHARRLALLSAGWLVSACEQGEQGPPGEPGQSVPGPPGAPGTPGGPVGEPSLSGISPSTVFWEHDVDVVVSGFGTSFSENVVLDFGPGIDATPAAIASPTSLLTRLTISPDAALGPRDVSVTVGEVTLTLSGGLQVAAPLAGYAIPEWGTLAQGSMVRMEAVGLDPDRPLVGFEPQLFLTDGSADMPGLLDTAPVLSSPFSIVYFQPLDVFGPTGPLDLVFDSPQLTSRAADAVTVASRTPTSLVSGSNPASVAEPRETDLFQINSAVDEWLHVRSTSADLVAEPAFFLLPASGRFTDRAQILPTLDYSRFNELYVLASAGDAHFPVYWDNSGHSGYDYDLELARLSTTAPIQAEIEAAGSFDWFHVTLAAGQTLTLAVGDGALSACAFDFAAELRVYRESDGALLEYNQDICPGYLLEFEGSLFLTPPIQITAPTSGGYMVGVSDSTAYCSGGCPSDYSLSVEVSQ